MQNRYQSRRQYVRKSLGKAKDVDVDSPYVNLLHLSVWGRCACVCMVKLDHINERSFVGRNVCRWTHTVRPLLRSPPI